MKKKYYLWLPVLAYNTCFRQLSQNKKNLA